MKNIQYFIISILVLACCIPIVSANQTSPPDAVRIAGYISTHNQIGVWWMNPINTYDFDGTQVWFDNIFISNFTNTTHFYSAEFLSLGNHTISVTTYDYYGNINMSFSNLTVSNDGYYVCKEDWYCGDYCAPYVIGNKTAIDIANISQGQPSAQSAKQYTDILLWYASLSITILLMIFSRDINIKTIKPILFAMLSLIFSIAMTYMSLSIARMGDFGQGIVINYTNQTNTAILYYQIVMVETAPWITALCVCITILVFVNLVDIFMRYLHRPKDINDIPIDDLKRGIMIKK